MSRFIDTGALKKAIRACAYPLTDDHNHRDLGMFMTGIEQAIDEAPDEEPTLYGYDIKNLITVAMLLREEGYTPQCVRRYMQDAWLIVDRLPWARD